MFRLNPTESWAFALETFAAIVQMASNMMR
jgi:hypothetical protein